MTLSRWRCGAGSNAPSIGSATPTSPSSTAAATSIATAISTASPRSASARLRYPVLWESTAPDGPRRADWSWPDRRLPALRERGIAPIVGLVHHGSGPRHTSLLCPRFAEGLAAFAAAVARRYPWVEHWTPVNEPLTTARFSALYGLWYPHARDDRSFVVAPCSTSAGPRCCRWRRSAASIRRRGWSRPTTSAAPTAPSAMGGVVDFYNERRWLAWDLLCGRVGPRPSALELPDRQRRRCRELLWFADHPCPPDIIGANYYVTSERWLDHRVERYPGRVRAAARPAASSSTSSRFASWRRPRRRSRRCCEETWQRYGIPMAVTEAHIDAGREDQLRWLLEIWRAAQSRARGRRRRACRHRLVAARLVRLELPARRVPRLLRARAVRRARADAAADRAGGADRASSPPARRSEPPGAARRRLVAPRRSLHRQAGRAAHDGHDAGRLSPARAAAPTSRRSSSAARAARSARRSRRSARSATSPAAFSTAPRWTSPIRASVRRRDRALEAVGDRQRERLRAHRRRRVRRRALHARERARPGGARRGLRPRRHPPRHVLERPGVRRPRRSRPGSRATRRRRSTSTARARLRPSATCWRAAAGAMVVRTSAFFGPWDRHNFVFHALAALAARRDLPRRRPTSRDLADLRARPRQRLPRSADRRRDAASGISPTSATSAGPSSRPAPPSSPASRRRRCSRAPSAALGEVAARPRHGVLASERAALMPSLDDALAAIPGDRVARALRASTRHRRRRPRCRRLASPADCRAHARVRLARHAPCLSLRPASWRAAGSLLQTHPPAPAAHLALPTSDLSEPCHTSSSSPTCAGTSSSSARSTCCRAWRATSTSSSSRSRCTPSGPAYLERTTPCKGVEVLRAHTPVEAGGFHDDQLSALQPMIAGYLADNLHRRLPGLVLHADGAAAARRPDAARRSSTTAWTSCRRSRTRRGRCASARRRC